jgi:hypothetical protein
VASGDGRRIRGKPGSYPGRYTVKLAVFVGFHEYFLQSKAEGNDGEEKSDETNGAAKIKKKGEASVNA